MIDIKAHGCIPGSTDSTARFADALAIAAATGEELYIPSGRYILGCEMAGRGNVRIRGESRAAVLFWPHDAVSAGLTITLEPCEAFAGCSSIADIERITLATGKSGGAGLYIVGDPTVAGDRLTQRATVRDVTVRGVNEFASGFDTALRFTNVSAATVDNFSGFGQIGAAGEPSYVASCGIRYDNDNHATPHPAALNVSKSYLAYFKAGVHCIDFEGAVIHQTNLMAVNWGAVFSSPAGVHRPYCEFSSSHVNSSDVAVCIDGMYQANVHDSLLYKQLGTAHGIGILVKSDAEYFALDNNTFENLSPTVGMNCIQIEKGGRGSIYRNLVRRADALNGTPGTAIWLTEGSHRCREFGSVIHNTATRLLDEGADNIVNA